MDGAGNVAPVASMARSSKPRRRAGKQGELAGAAREVLLAVAVGTGLAVLHSLDADVDWLVAQGATATPSGSRSATAPSPAASPWGGRRVRVERPRVRRADGAGELPLPTWQAFAGDPVAGPACCGADAPPGCRPAATPPGWSRSAYEGFPDLSEGQLYPWFRGAVAGVAGGLPAAVGPLPAPRRRPAGLVYLAGLWLIATPYGPDG
jgi:hypothetical protein